MYRLRALSHTHVWHSRVILQVIQVTHTHACIQKIFCGGVKKVCGWPFKMRSVGLVETETFFSEALHVHTV